MGQNFRMSKITQKYLESLTDSADGQTLREAGGLVAKVRIGKRGITVMFRFEYKFEGKKRDLRLGTWPKLSLAEIRKSRDNARHLLLQEIDPATARKAAKYEAQRALEQEIQIHETKSDDDLTVEDLFNEWLEHGVARKDGNAELMRSFSKDVLPTLQRIRIKDLSEKHLLKTYKTVKERGVNRTVVILHNDISQMLKWAEKRKPWRALMEDGNPSDLINLKMILDKNYQAERDRVLEDAEIQELYERFITLENEYAALPSGQKYSGIRPVDQKAQCAIWICLGTLCRIGELLQARWQDVDFSKRIWRIPAENTKQHSGRQQDHNVYISDFALTYFKLLHTLTGDTEFLFPSRDKHSHVCLKTMSKKIGDRQIRFKQRKGPMSNRCHDDTLVLTRGEDREWTPHDLRRTGATIMQRLAIPLDIIDRCQNHVLAGSKVRRHYMHYDYATEKSEAWQKLGEHIKELLSEPTG